MTPHDPEPGVGASYEGSCLGKCAEGKCALKRAGRANGGGNSVETDVRDAVDEVAGVHVVVGVAEVIVLLRKVSPAMLSIEIRS